jgi:hypothetical protein
MNAHQEKLIQGLLEQPDGLGELVPNSKGIAKIKAGLDSLKLGGSDWAACVRSGLYMRFNFLDESHTISQGIHTVEGSYWHAIMHRREPDYSNAKYWFQRVGPHPVFEELAKSEAAKAALGTAQYDPFVFVDFCASAERDDLKRTLAIDVQRTEWELLFAYCCQNVP